MFVSPHAAGYEYEYHLLWHRIWRREELLWYEYHNIPYFSEEVSLTRREGVIQVDRDGYIMLYPKPAQAIELMRLFLKQMLWALGMRYPDVAIGVSNIDSARFLEKVLGWGGHIIDLSCLQYPGFNRFRAGYLQHFCECGHNAHIPDGQHGWVPTFVCRSNGGYGYLKCTARSVQVMRHWTEFWYPTMVLQRSLFQKKSWLDGVYSVERHDKFFREFMALRTLELEKRFPDIDWRRWYDPCNDPRPRLQILEGHLPDIPLRVNLGDLQTRSWTRPWTPAEARRARGEPEPTGNAIPRITWKPAH